MVVRACARPVSGLVRAVPARIPTSPRLALQQESLFLSEARVLRTLTLLSHPSRGMASTRSSAPDRISLHVAASFVGKGVRFDPSRHSFDFDPVAQPCFPVSPDSALANKPESGHDAFFVSKMGGQEEKVAMGVADGVGGWADMGVDPGKFSHTFCGYMAAAATTATAGGKLIAGGTPATARGVMESGYTASCFDPRLRAGGSTACVAVVSPDGVLDVANLGDSGFLVLRSSAVHVSSQPQTHAFNTPFQLSVVPPAVAARMATFGGAHHVDLPSDADVSRVALRRGDVVLLATDGVWDNLFNQDVLRVVSQVMMRRGGWELGEGEGEGEGGVRVSAELEERCVRVRGRARAGAGEEENATPELTLQAELAVELTATAKAASLNKQIQSPFGKAIRRHFPDEHWNGGKIDDICVVVGVVTEESPRPEPKARL